MTTAITPRVHVPREELAEFCRRYRIRKLAFFGSVLRDDFGPKSDIDVLVEFEPDHVVGFGIIEIEEELSRLLGGRRVDLVREKYLNARLRDRVLSSAQVQYTEGWPRLSGPYFRHGSPHRREGEWQVPRRVRCR